MRVPNPRPLLPLLLIGLALAVVGSGCGTESSDSSRGRMLFVEKCGTCHALAQAGTKAQVGPDLDRAFAAARQVGFDSDTVEGIVSNQIEHPRDEGINKIGPKMPADIVTGQDRIDVSAYVAKWAGVPGAKPPRVPGGPGAQVFAQFGCAGCHALAAAEAGGVTGPNLDEALPGQSDSMIRESIVDPDKEIARGYPPNVMPDNFEQIIPKPEIEQLVEYLASRAGGGNASK
ncbi:MAG: cytochrome c [Solirubrobacterales bacterium]